MQHNKFIGLLIISLFYIALASCKKENSIEGPKIIVNNNTTIKDTVYKEYKIADFETGVLPSSFVVGKETWGAPQILKDTTDKYINYYFSLVNSVCTWDWYQGELRIDAFNLGNKDSIFHFKTLANMDSLNVSNTYLNFNLGGFSDIWPKAFVTVTLIPKINSANSFTYNISQTFTGWKSVSIPFNAFTDTTNASMKDFSKIKGIHFTLFYEKGKNTGKKPLSMLLDNIVITQNKVYQFN